MYTDHVITPEEHGSWFQRVTTDTRYKIWIIADGSEGVGLANLYAIDYANRRCYWAYYVADPLRRGTGIGSATEFLVLAFVFDRLQLNKLCCEVLSFNTPVVAVHLKFGFTQEGLLRQHIYKGGKYHEVVSLGLLREEWERSKRQMAERIQQRYPNIDLTGALRS
jgi:UDP-4-amino-4,6-dideoxy-N-acetyl-beta-L-altrosamine N-acetyltransferase